MRALPSCHSAHQERPGKLSGQLLLQECLAGEGEALHLITRHWALGFNKDLGGNRSPLLPERTVANETFSIFRKASTTHNTNSATRIQTVNDITPQMYLREGPFQSPPTKAITAKCLRPKTEPRTTFYIRCYNI